MNPLRVPQWLQEVLFAGVIAWETVAAVCFWLAFARFRDRPLAADPLTIAACALNLALWAAFQILDEVFLAYAPEAVHRVLFGNMLLTLLALYALQPHAPYLPKEQ